MTIRQPWKVSTSGPRWAQRQTWDVSRCQRHTWRTWGDEVPGAQGGCRRGRENSNWLGGERKAEHAHMAASPGSSVPPRLCLEVSAGAEQRPAPPARREAVRLASDHWAALWRERVAGLISRGLFVSLQELQIDSSVLVLRSYLLVARRVS